MQVKYLLWDRKAMRVVGHGGVASDNWEAHAAEVAKKGFEMAPVDAEQLDVLKQHGPQNFRVKDDYSLELLPSEQRNLAPVVIDNVDDSIALLREIRDLTRQMVEALKKL